MLLLHGWACSAYSFEALYEPLGAAGRRAIAIELPGHGLSDKPLDEHAYTLDAMADAVAQAATALGIVETDVVGFSMGCAVALALATRRDVQVRRVALVSPLGLDRIRLATLARFVTPRAMMRMLPGAVPRAAVKAVLHAVYGRRRPPTERDVDHYWAPTAFPAFGFAMIALLRQFEWGTWDAGRLHAIAQPALLVCGLRDRLVRHGEVASSARALPSATVLALRDVGHAPLAEAPEEAVPAIVGFLARGA